MAFAIAIIVASAIPALHIMNARHSVCPISCSNMLHTSYCYVGIGVINIVIL